jgi:hypothetical protein
VAPEPATSGRGYLAAAARARTARRSRTDVVAAALEEVRAGLLTAGRDATPWTPRGEDADAHYGATVLVPKAAAIAFEAACAAAAARLARDAIDFEVTGPWPCAVFARLAMEAAGAASGAAPKATPGAAAAA